MNTLVYIYTNFIEELVSFPGILASIQDIPNANVVHPSIEPGTISGTLYVPDANCSNPVPGGLPLDQLPHGINLIAIISSVSCAQASFQQAQEDGAGAAVILDYDASSQPSTAFNQPIYGISSTDTETLRQNLATYSGDISNVNSTISSAAIYNSADLVTLNLTITTPKPGSMPWNLIIGIAAGVVVALLVGCVFGWRCQVRRTKTRRLKVP